MGLISHTFNNMDEQCFIYITFKFLTNLCLEYTYQVWTLFLLKGITDCPKVFCVEQLVLFLV